MKTLNIHQELKSNLELIDIIKKLSKYDLGITLPHMHDVNGSIKKLPSGYISQEDNLKISFIEKNSFSNTTVPVSWRWNGASVEVCAACCGDYDPPDPSPDY